MTQDIIGNWIESAKSSALPAPQTSNVKVIRRASKSKGQIIMEMAERFLPWLMKMAEGIRDDEGLPVQPAHVRSVALNLAQRVVKEQEKKSHA